MSIQIGALAPKIKVSEWVQGRPIDTTQEKGNVVVAEVFQVNCPGCFLYGLPEIINIYNPKSGSNKLTNLNEKKSTKNKQNP